jgi:hypothetical protein
MHPKVAYAVLFALVLSPAALAADDPKPATPKFKISKETTYVTGPVRADGTIDYVEAINAELARGVTKENNAAIPIIEAVVMRDPGPNGHYVPIRKKLGLPEPAALPQDAPRRQPPDFDRSNQGPWTADRYPDIAQWLKDNQKSLDLVVAASQRDRYYMPLVREHPDDPIVNVLLPQLNLMREFANELRARAMLRLGSDDSDGFCRDIIAVVRLGRLNTHGPTLVENLVGTGVEVVGLDAIKIAATGGWLSEGQVEKLLTDLRHAPPRRSMGQAFEGGERGFLLEFLQSAAVHGVARVQEQLTAIDRHADFKLPPIDPANKDWDAALRKANAWYDRFAAIGKLPTFTQRLAAASALTRDVAALRARLSGWQGVLAPFEDRLFVLLLPSMERAFTVEARLAVNEKLTQTALALSGMRSKTGEYPPELTVLVPTYFKAVPIDDFTDKPLSYKQEGNGYYLSSPGPSSAPAGARRDDLIVEVNR